MKVVVTGATGFLGGRTVEGLLSENYEVTATGRNASKISELKELGAEALQGNLEDQEFTDQLTKSADVVVHSAALSSPWGRFDEFYKANILATKNIINSCHKNKVQRLVHISTPSIYFDYTDRFDIMEDFLPDQFVNHYAETKFEAEKLVDKAFIEGLETISLRPRAIVGGGDTTIMPRLLKAQAEGKLKIIGDGKNTVDVTSVSNVVQAVLLSIKAGDKALGHKYNITNGDPVKLWELIENTLSRLDMKLNKQKVPFFVVYNVAKAMETMAKFSSDYKEPVLTCYGVGILARSMTMNIEKARNQLDYNPKQSNYEAVDEFVNWWKSKS